MGIVGNADTACHILLGFPQSRLKPRYPRFEGIDVR